MVQLSDGASCTAGVILAKAAEQEKRYQERILSVREIAERVKCYGEIQEQVGKIDDDKIRAALIAKADEILSAIFTTASDEQQEPVLRSEIK